MADNILQVKNLKISFRTVSGTVKAVRDISFNLKRGETLSIVGESGSGKSVTSKAILGILAGNSIIEGGEILYVESSLNKGKGNLILTGNLGDVMKESASIALGWIRAHADQLGIDSKLFEENDIHIHVPEGAIPKDGPSAGITMVTALASVFTGRKVQARYAMTGETTLRGKVLPVGGVKEKILAAKRAGITDIILSAENRKDIEDIKADYVKGLKFHYVNTLDDVLKLALV